MMLSWLPTFILCAPWILIVQASLRPQRQARQAGAYSCSAFGGIPGTCTTLSQCYNFGENIEKIAGTTCFLAPYGDVGVCCPSASPPDPSHSVPGPIASVTLREKRPVPSVSADQIQQASVAGQNALRTREEIETRIAQAGLTTRRGTPQEDHNQIVYTFPKALELGRQAAIALKATQDMVEQLDLRNQEGALALQLINLTNTGMGNFFPAQPVCLELKYRTMDGSCNNLMNRDWGMSFRAFGRLLPPVYGDGLVSPRVASDGNALPSTRLVRATVLPDFNNELPLISLYIMSWGQFVSHDLQLTPIQKGANGSSITCCQQEVLDNPDLRHPECFPIDIPANDDFFSQYQQTCMEFVRALGAPRTDRAFGPREQMNQLTSFLDGSQVYGSTAKQASELRSNQNGKLKTATTHGKGLPPNRDSSSCTGNPSAGNFCFQAGDVRLNVQPQLATLHIIFLREHNRLADELALQNPGWGDEIIFQEARRIVGAIIQHITYKEFLPIVLGRKVMRSFEILTQKSGFSSNYDPSIDPTILNEFASAAFRYGHSTAPGIFQVRGSANQLLRNHILRPYQANLLDGYLSGGAHQSGQAVDNSVTEEVTNHLFQRANSSFGLDLAAMDIQRGRDNGLPSYNEYRQICGLSRATSFEDIASFSNADVAKRMSTVYRNVDDIDLLVGGVSETPLPGAIVGPTFACLVGEQFRRLRRGDRFWYERGNAESSFSERQLKEIRKVSLARIICDNSDAILTMQPLVFFKPADWNPEVSCSCKSIPKMSLRPWKNEPVWT